jgi:hypothetical protein
MSGLGVAIGGCANTTNGIVLDRLTPTQRRILELLDIDVPWPSNDR